MRQFRRRLAGKPLQPFVYRDFGSLVSLGEYSTVGNLMGFVVGSSMLVEGCSRGSCTARSTRCTRWPCTAPSRSPLDTLARALTRRTEPQVKLH